MIEPQPSELSRGGEWPQTLGEAITMLAITQWHPGDRTYFQLSADALTMYVRQRQGLEPDVPVDLNTIGPNIRQQLQDLVDLERDSLEGI